MIYNRSRCSRFFLHPTLRPRPFTSFHYPPSPTRALDKNSVFYSINVKTSVYQEGAAGSTDGWKWIEGSTHLTVKRTGRSWTDPSVSWEQSLSQGWGSCGKGRSLGNRLTYNRMLNRWGRYCWTDECYADDYGDGKKPAGVGEKCYGTYFGTVPKLNICIIFSVAKYLH